MHLAASLAVVVLSINKVGGALWNIIPPDRSLVISNSATRGIAAIDTSRLLSGPISSRNVGRTSAYSGPICAAKGASERPLSSWHSLMTGCCGIMGIDQCRIEHAVRYGRDYHDG